MQIGEWLWFDGVIRKQESQIEIKYFLLSHALHYGTGTFEGIRFYKTSRGPAVFRLPDHIKRLFNSAGAIGIELPYSAERLIQVTKDLIWLNKIEEGYVRPIVFYGYGKMGVNPLGYREKGQKAVLTRLPTGGLRVLTRPPTGGLAEVSCAIMIWSWKSYIGDNNARLKISPFRRNHPQSVIMDAKLTGPYINSALAVMDASKSGYDEAVLLDWKGRVAEGSGENIFIVNKRGQLQTTPAGTILPGITRDTVMTIAQEMNIPVVERHFYQNVLKTAKEVFLCGTAVEITPVFSVDDCVIGGGETGSITAAIKERYSRIVHGEDERYHHWLTFLE